MKEELQKKLYEKYTRIFEQRTLPMSQTCMCWGIETDSGWYDLIDTLCSQLDAIHKLTGIVTVAIQVKEKFGTLRFYTTSDSDEGELKIDQEDLKVWWGIADACIGEAEDQSAQTCEVCGEYGKLCSKGGWYQTLCKEHAKENGYNYGTKDSQEETSPTDSPAASSEASPEEGDAEGEEVESSSSAG